MIDLVRVGGITQWLKVAGMAEAFNLPVVSHLIPEVHVHLIGAMPNGLTVEYMPWLVPLFEEVPRQQNGELAMPTAPGLGLKFDQATIDRYRVPKMQPGALHRRDERHYRSNQLRIRDSVCRNCYRAKFRCYSAAERAHHAVIRLSTCSDADAFCPAAGNLPREVAMKISRIRSQILVLPEADPLAEAPENPNAARPIVILRLGTDDGIEGIGVTFYGGAMTAHA